MKRERLIQRSRRLLGVFSGRIQAKCCFIHIPKCAGNSIAHGLRNATPLLAHNAWIEVMESRIAASVQEEGIAAPLEYHEDGDRCESAFAVRQTLAAYHFAAGAPVICGHFLFDKTLHEVYAGQYRFVTMIRPPVERMISHYAEEVSSGVIKTDFEEYLETSMAERHANTLTRYLAGLPDIRQPDPAAIERAKENLSSFDLVGLLSRTDKFEKALSEMLGARINIGHERKAAVAKPQLSPSTRRRLEEMCAGDEEVFQYALETKAV